jgi:hypothetical protein
MPVTWHPPRGSVRAALPHTALTLDEERRSAHGDKDVELGVGESSDPKEEPEAPTGSMRVDCDGLERRATTNARGT